MAIIGLSEGQIRLGATQADKAAAIRQVGWRQVDTNNSDPGYAESSLGRDALAQEAFNHRAATKVRAS